MSIPIDELRMCNATRNLLKRNNVLTLGDIQSLSVQEMVSMHIGPTRYSELFKAVKEGSNV